VNADALFFECGDLSPHSKISGGPTMEILKRLARIRFALLIAVAGLLVFTVLFAVAAGLYLWATAPRDNAKIIKNQIGMEFVSLSPGHFMMGSDKGKPDEQPAHQITISTPLLMGRYEVSQGEWKTVMGREHAGFKGSSFPVQFVTWQDTQDFIARLNQSNDGYTYRLPTEAEWEYACRAGTNTEYADELPWLAWYSGNSDQKVHPVGHLHPNAWGLYDMHGNVSEFCQDWYDANYYQNSPAADPTGPTNGKERMLRGGSFFDSGARPGSVDDRLRSAARNHTPPDLGTLEEYGFRIVAVPRSR
jgi:formylglycine-generating enzyme required for sulfatase activity